mmetsp:Transcript_54627/g.152473  ORF Transcript_54627/g.152473 Transcript_54627/m.152473 type:complete len:566 (+) Transcript_54627:43-1740(+)|eukprot:CAMPEP_0117556446 /NCGR_PEP_ID=MMETSP0784-20121206/51812_1 /TAXON_ID=39447 /ORGANISM="" /LENGTH=565 /DNA_ID=CAMNT_0005353719 /DNA_START=43 /DNA_END=1740 /DNA_ORIENTATION=+
MKGQSQAMKTKVRTGSAVIKSQSKSQIAQRKAGRRLLRNAFVLKLRQTEQARRGNKIEAASKSVTEAATEVPIKERAGYPLVPTKVKPENWRTVEGKPIFVDLTRVTWLPDDFGQGVKMTNPISRSVGGGGGTYTVWVGPEGKVYYHRHTVEQDLGRKLGAQDGFNGQLRMAQLQGKHSDEKKVFGLLNKKEKACLVGKEHFHFCIISARRTRTPEGLRDIAMVQAQFKLSGVDPTWYVDEPSLQEYRNLGLKAVVGGRLTDARNRALDDARRKGLVCVQTSDDIAKWEYHDGKQAEDRTDEAVNAAFAAATCYVLSPVTAARLLLSKMRGVAGPGETPKLGGVYPLATCSRAFGGDVVSRRNFILGDFFVADRSPVRFDTEMTLKEDYAFTCAHIEKHGSVLRLNRMSVHAKHQTNAGGACSVRDKKGLEEQKNIRILCKRWPGAFSLNPKRKNEVILRWPKNGCKDTEDSADVASDASRATRKPTTARKLVKKDLLRKAHPVRSWTADTKIVYGPNLKTKGTVSFTRYQKYRRATTVGRALALGSKRSDLYWDFDRGMLKKAA